MLPNALLVVKMPPLAAHNFVEALLELPRQLTRFEEQGWRLFDLCD
jgi:hypothetical protein